MTGMLASVNSLAEAHLAMAAQVDIIDLKNPSTGSLGALPTALIKEIVAGINSQCPISCTVGDLPMDAQLVYDATLAMAETGVNYVKIGILSDDGAGAVLQKLRPLAGRFPLIAVLFADNPPDFALIDQLHQAGFAGVMLDTLDKSKGSLTGMMSSAEIEQFVSQVRSRRIICGLAGSLQLDDIPLLLPLKPDYLGFRGALCDGGNRLAGINGQSVSQIKRAIRMR